MHNLLERILVKKGQGVVEEVQIEFDPDCIFEPLEERTDLYWHLKVRTEKGMQNLKVRVRNLGAEPREFGKGYQIFYRKPLLGCAYCESI